MYHHGSSLSFFMNHQKNKRKKKHPGSAEMLFLF